MTLSRFTLGGQFRFNYCICSILITNKLINITPISRHITFPILRDKTNISYNIISSSSCSIYCLFLKLSPFTDSIRIFHLREGIINLFKCFSSITKMISPSSSFDSHRNSPRNKRRRYCCCISDYSYPVNNCCSNLSCFNILYETSYTYD